MDYQLDEMDNCETEIVQSAEKQLTNIKNDLTRIDYVLTGLENSQIQIVQGWDKHCTAIDN